MPDSHFRSCTWNVGTSLLGRRGLEASWSSLAHPSYLTWWVSGHWKKKLSKNILLGAREIIYEVDLWPTHKYILSFLGILWMYFKWMSPPSDSFIQGTPEGLYPPSKASLKVSSFFPTVKGFHSFACLQVNSLFFLSSEWSSLIPWDLLKSKRILR